MRRPHSIGPGIRRTDIHCRASHKRSHDAERQAVLPINRSANTKTESSAGQSLLDVTLIALAARVGVLVSRDTHAIVTSKGGSHACRSVCHMQRTVVARKVASSHAYVRARIRGAGLYCTKPTLCRHTRRPWTDCASDYIRDTVHIHRKWIRYDAHMLL